MRNVFTWTVLVAALGYFVDMFDLTIFGVVRVPSLQDLGVADLTGAGILLVNLGAAGMLLGGLLWGVLGDKRGRLSVLYGSILLYSVANVLNAFAPNLAAYGVLRFLAGVGLAGELGAAVTLVSELLSKEDRGYGTTLIATLGLLGSVAASLVGQLLPWKAAYLIGGGMGFALLAARFRMADSQLFSRTGSRAPKGSLALLLSGGRLRRYLQCVLIGVPVYFITGILFTFAPELAKAPGVPGVTAGNALLFGTIGLTAGDLASGLLSQALRSRRAALLVFVAGGAAGTAAYFAAHGARPALFYAICAALGFSAGFWAVLVTMTAEQFGTNLRSTAATSVPNFVRSAVIPLTLSFTALRGHGAPFAALTVGVVVFALAFAALWAVPETYGRDLDFLEEAEAELAAVTEPA